MGLLKTAPVSDWGCFFCVRTVCNYLQPENIPTTGYNLLMTVRLISSYICPSVFLVYKQYNGFGVEYSPWFASHEPVVSWTQTTADQ